MARVDLSNYYAMKGWNNLTGAAPAPATPSPAAPPTAQPTYIAPATPAPTYTAGPDTSGNTMYATGTAGPPTFDWRQGVWQVANRWAPDWAMANPYTAITDANQVATALSGYAPAQRTPAWTAWNNDLTYLKAGQTNTAMPTWYGISQPWGQVAQTPTTAPTPSYTPSPGVPTFNWSQWGGQTATNPIQTYAGTPAWMNDPNWITNPALTSQAEKWAAVMVPWSQAQQNAYQYANDANEAQRRYNLDFGWRQAQDQFTMDQAAKAFDYQKERDKEEFGLARQQIWSRNVTPNTRWMRSWG